MAEGDRDPLLLTPGPLTTADSTKRAMLHDWGSRDGAFIAMTLRDVLRAASPARLRDLSGKLTVADSLRVGCIGHRGETDMRDALLAMETVLKEMGVLDCRPKSSVPAPAP